MIIKHEIFLKLKQLINSVGLLFSTASDFISMRL